MENNPKALAETAGNYCHPMNVISGGKHPGRLPPVKEFLRLEADSTVYSSLGLDADGALVVRLYETAGKQDRVTVTAPLESTGAELADLDGKPSASLSPQGNQVSFDLPPHRIAGLRLKFK